MAGYVISIEEATMHNDNFRKVLNTAEHSQLVVMSLLPGEDIGTEVHDLDQFIHFESGRGKVILGPSLPTIDLFLRYAHLEDRFT